MTDANCWTIYFVIALAVYAGASSWFYYKEDDLGAAFLFGFILGVLWFPWLVCGMLMAIPRLVIEALLRLEERRERLNEEL